MGEPIHKKMNRGSPEAKRLLEALELDRDELAQALRVVEACRERRAMTIQRLVAAGVSLAWIADTAGISRSMAKQIADRQGRLA